MIWFIPMGISVGVLLTRTAWQEWRDGQGSRQPGGIRLLVALAWIPLLAWIISQFVEQY